MKKDYFCLIGLLFLSITIGLLNFFALKYNLFWVFKWFDIPMHFLGGVFISFLASYFILFKNINITYTKFLLFNIFAILVFGTLWEVFEVFIGSTSIYDISYCSDTGLDIMADLLGSISGALIIYNKK